MQIEVIGVLKFFLAFASSFQPHDVHNILVFMLDSCFKNFATHWRLCWPWIGHVGCYKLWLRELMPPLLIVYHALTPNSTSMTFVASTMVELNVFESLVFAKEVTMGLIKVEL